MVPGLGVDSAQQIIAEVGAKAATFRGQTQAITCGQEDRICSISQRIGNPSSRRAVAALPPQR